jgi:hypothetical protein
VQSPLAANLDELEYGGVPPVTSTCAVEVLLLQLPTVLVPLSESTWMLEVMVMLCVAEQPLAYDAVTV